MSCIQAAHTMKPALVIPPSTAELSTSSQKKMLTVDMAMTCK